MPMPAWMTSTKCNDTLRVCSCVSIEWTMERWPVSRRRVTCECKCTKIVNYALNMRDTCRHYLKYTLLKFVFFFLHVIVLQFATVLEQRYLRNKNHFLKLKWPSALACPLIDHRTLSSRHFGKEDSFIRIWKRFRRIMHRVNLVRKFPRHNSTRQLYN